MKYLAIFVLITFSFSQINSTVNNIIKQSLRKKDDISSTSVETHLRDSKITTTIHPEITTTIIFPLVTVSHPETPVVSDSDSPVIHEVSTLVELPVDYHTSISYYYPYFYKAHLITFADEVDTSILVRSCSPDSHCSYCDPLNFDHCHRCDIGYFLNGFGCELFCPEGYISDVLRLKCFPALSTGKTLIFIK